MMIQIQDWKCDKKIVVVDEINHGTVQVEIPKPGEYKDKYYQHADCASTTFGWMRNIASRVRHAS